MTIFKSTFRFFNLCGCGLGGFLDIPGPGFSWLRSEIFIVILNDFDYFLPHVGFNFYLMPITYFVCYIAMSLVNMDTG